MGPDAMILVLIFSFKPACELLFFTLIKTLFSSSSCLPLRVGIMRMSVVVDVSSAYFDSNL